MIDTEQNKKQLIKMVRAAQRFADKNFPKRYFITIRETENMSMFDFQTLAETIINRTCEYLDLNVNVFTGTNRRRIYVDGRIMFANYILETYKSVILTQLGKTIGKDHATIIHYKMKHANFMQFDLQYRERYIQLCQILDSKC